MPGNNGGTGFDLLTEATHDVAREIGEMDPNDPLRPERVKRTLRADTARQIDPSQTKQTDLR